MRERIIHEICKTKIIAIARGLEPQQVIPVSEALFDGGITLLELTFDQCNPDSWQQTADSIRTVKAHMDGKMLVGA